MKSPWNLTHRLLATGIAALVSGTILVVPAGAQAAAPQRDRKPVPSVAVKFAQASAAAAAAAKSDPIPAPVWPTAGTVDLGLPAPGRRIGGLENETAGKPSFSAQVKAGGLPVRAAAEPEEAPAALRLQVFDRSDTATAKVSGVLIRVTPALRFGASRAGRAQIEVDYSAFATAYGADWSSRLRLVQLPECALTTPGVQGCTGTVLPTKNNSAKKTVSAPVSFGGGATLLSVEGGTSGAAGDYKATSLQPSSTWTAGGSSGAFTWNYPLRVPPSANGPKPNFSLSYSSQSVDGRHAASNNQPSWMGEGFEMSPGGYIERRYSTCSDDMKNGANNTTKKGDQCWVTDNATLSLDGTSGELIYNSTENRWHLRGDDASRIERKTGRDNGDDNGEYWVVTTGAGMQYWFGAHKLPGWANGDPVTKSVWTAPVFGNHTGEPCHQTSFASSHCVQAYRWNLDYVVDLHGNSMSYWYETETNKYGRNDTPTDAAQYVRGGYLDHISYMTRTDNDIDNVLDAQPPAKVVFTVGDRCLSSCGTHDAAHWTDTPFDQECNASPCNITSPTFWTTKRLASISTHVLNSSAYRDVEKWTFTHSYPNPGDGTRAGLWLEKISHQGLAGPVVTMPDMVFTPGSMDNRVDGIDGAPAMAWHRIARIDTETGGALAITYSTRDCQPGETMPAAHLNTRRCYPSNWIREGDENPTPDWFHKYVVTELREIDLVGSQPSIVYRYDYLGGAAWHYADEDGLTKEDYKTWNVYRGYERVTVTKGEGDDIRSFNETRFFRGMNGDKMPTGQPARVASVTDSKGGTWPDDDWFNGMTRESISFNGVGGAEVSGDISTPWASAATATRTINSVTVESRFVRTGEVLSRTARDGGRPDRVTKKATAFDAYGMETRVDEFGIDGVSDDEKCTKTTYEPRNMTDWVISNAHQVQQFAVTCAASDTLANLTEAHVISVQRSLYDNHAYLAAPGKGLITSSQDATAWNSGNPTFITIGSSTYDTHGRPTHVKDALNRPTNTAYTPTAGGPVTQTKMTNALGHETITTVDPAFGNSTDVVDANGKKTEIVYDGMGRLTGVWLPGRNRATETANMIYSYDVHKDKVTSVASQTLTTTGTYITSHVLMDGLLREVQTQAPGPEGGRVLTNTFYNTLGQTWQKYKSYHNSLAVSTDLVIPVEPHNIPTQYRYYFDGAGRGIAEVLQPYGVERWRTSTAYGGDRVDVTPPQGGTPRSTFTNADGNTTAIWQYHGTVAAGSHDAVNYVYNPKDLLESVEDADGNDWVYTYDFRGRESTFSDPDRGLTRTFYDNAGQVTHVIDGRNVRLAYTYDDLGRKTAMYYNQPIGTPLARWMYDTVAKGYLDQSIRMVGGNAYVSRIDGYSDLYKPTSTTVVIPEAETGLGGIYTYTHTFHVNGAANSTTFPVTKDLPTETTYTEYNEVGLPTRMLANLNGTNLSYVTGTQYNALGLADRYELYTGHYSQTGDKVRLGFERELETGRLTRMWTDKDQAPYTIADASYTYDHSGNVMSMKDAATSDNQCFAYDYLRRLEEAWTPEDGNCSAERDTDDLGGPAPYWTSWSYDTIGNRETQVDHTSSGDSTTTYTYPSPGAARPHALQSTTAGATWSYDNAGNTTSRPGASGQQTLTWDSEGHLATLKDGPTGPTTTYVYDAEGNRLIAKDPTGKTLWLPGQQVRYTTSTTQSACTRFYTFDSNTIASRTASGLTWLATDHLDTAQIAVKEVGQQVTSRLQKPFGELRGNPVAWPNRQGYIGGDADPSGLIHLGAREYEPAVGRFISVDPIMDLNDPQQWHAYGYSNANPVTFSDPDGKLFGSLKKAFNNAVNNAVNTVKTVAADVGKAAATVGNAIVEHSGAISAGLGVLALACTIIPPLQVAAPFLAGASMAFGAIDTINSARKGEWVDAGIGAIGLIPGGKALTYGIKGLGAIKAVKSAAGELSEIGKAARAIQDDAWNLFKKTKDFKYLDRWDAAKGIVDDARGAWNQAKSAKSALDRLALPWEAASAAFLAENVLYEFSGIPSRHENIFGEKKCIVKKIQRTPSQPPTPPAPSSTGGGRVHVRGGWLLE